MSRLIVSPTVFLLAQSMVREKDLLEWADFNGLCNEDDLAPISQLIDDHEDFHLSRLVEFAGRHCYRSWKKGRNRADYIKNIIESGHGSVLEHASMTFAIQGVSRTLTHELVRHRVGVGISQESQRYVDAAEIKFVIPPLLLCVSKGVTDPPHDCIVEFEEQCLRDLRQYTQLQRDLAGSQDLKVHGGLYHFTSKTLMQKRFNETARAHLPGCSETRLTWTANIRTLRHVFEIRGSEHADLEVRRLVCHLHDICQFEAPHFFYDFKQVDGPFGVNCVVKQ